MWGYGILWIIFAVVTIGMKFPRIGFSMAWWGFTFPLGMFSDLVLCIGFWGMGVWFLYWFVLLVGENFFC